MLKISPAVKVAGLAGTSAGHAERYTNDYMLFPDSEDPNVYYALAENPIFLADGYDNPGVNLTWYFGAGVTSGAICTMALALPVPDVGDLSVKGRIVEALREDKSTARIAKATFDLCKAMDAGDSARVAQLKQQLGMHDGMAESRKAAWNKWGDWEQFLPSNERLQIRPVPFKPGKLTIQAFASKDACKVGEAQFARSFETTPTLLNNHAALVTFNLSDPDANLFWHALGGWQPDSSSPKPAAFDRACGESAVISVIYQVAFDGALPEAKATVTLNQAVLSRLDIGTKAKAYNDAINSATEVVLPAGAFNDDQDSVQKVLTGWAADQLEDMLKTQFPQASLGDLSVEGAHTIQAVQQQSRTYKLSQPITLSKRSQALLSKMGDIVNATVLGKVFQLVDLNEVPSLKVGVTVQPPDFGFLKARHIDRFIVTHLNYADQSLLDANGNKVTVIEYTSAAMQQASTSLKGTLDRNTRNPTVHYSYLVSYADGTPAFRPPQLNRTDSNYLDLGSVDIGVLSVSLNSIDLPWDVLDRAEVLLRYGDWEKVILLRKDRPQLLVSQVFGQAMNQVMSYRLTLYPTSDIPVPGELIAVPLVRGQADITLRSPLGSRTSPILFELDADVDKAQLRLEYLFRSAGPDRVFRQLVQLDRAANISSYEWNVPVSDDSPSALRVVKARVNGTTDLRDLSGGSIDRLTSKIHMTVCADKLHAF